MFYDLIKLLVIQHEKALNFESDNQTANSEKSSANKYTLNAEYF